MKCESLLEDCDCHGAEGRIDVLYCSDLGLREDANSRASKSQNVRHYAWRQMMGRDDADVDGYDSERLESYRAAVLQFAKSARDLEGQRDTDCLHLVIKVDRKNSRGEGTLTTVQRDRTDPTGDSQLVSISRYLKWEVCLGIMDGLLDDETR